MAALATVNENNIKLYIAFRKSGLNEAEISLAMAQMGYTSTEVKNIAVAAISDEIEAKGLALVTRQPATRRERTPASEDVAHFLEQAVASGTRRTYGSGWRVFVAWCSKFKFSALPAEASTVEAFLAWRARQEGCRPATVDTNRAAISAAHRWSGYDDPCDTEVVTKILTGIRREFGMKQDHRKPVVTADIRKMLAAIDRQTLIGKRDAALVLLSFATASRSNETVHLNIEDLEERPEGYIVHIGRSKTDEEGRGFQKALVYGHNPDTCPILAIRAWVDAAGITTGRLFRSVNNRGVIGDGLTECAVRKITKKLATKAELKNLDKISSHSFRSGALTEAARRKIPMADMKRLSGHRSNAMVERYIHLESVFENTAAGQIGL